MLINSAQVRLSLYSQLGNYHNSSATLMSGVVYMIIGEFYKGEVTVGQDGMVIPLK